MPGIFLGIDVINSLSHRSYIPVDRRVGKEKLKNMQILFHIVKKCCEKIKLG